METNSSIYEIDKMLNERKPLFILFVMLFVLAMHIPFLIPVPTFNFDAFIYAGNIDKPFFKGYDVHAPGYVGYIYLARLINWFVHNSFLTQHLINMAAVLALTGGLMMFLLRLGRTNIEGILLTLLFMFNTVMMVGSLTGGNRLFLPLSSLCLLWLSHEIITGPKPKLLLVFGACFAILAGFRQDIIGYYFPLYLFLCYRVKDFKIIMLSGLIFALGAAFWAAPMFIEYGGVEKYFFIVRTQKVIYNSSMIASGIKLYTVANAMKVIVYIGWSLLLTWPLWLMGFAHKEKYDHDILTLLLLMLLPVVFVQLFIHNGNYVHLASLLLPAFLLLILRYRIRDVRNAITVMALVLMTMAQFYFLRPLSSERFIAKMANAVCLQYTYSGIKNGRLLLIKDVWRNKTINNN